IFVANGIFKDLTDQDYIQFYSDPNNVRRIIKTEDKAILKLIEKIPSEPLPNYAFHNDGQWHFTNQSTQWGLATPGFSNGSAYGDLDNDGDLDLVVNNVNMPPFIYRNNADTLFNHHYLSIQCRGEGRNTFALGTQVELYVGDEILYQEFNPMRGFQSTVEHRLHFGLGDYRQVDTLKVIWPDGRRTVLREVAVDRLLVLNQKDAVAMAPEKPEKPAPWLAPASVKVPFRHTENRYSDFDRDRLLYHMISREGPKMAVGDVNGDGRPDVYIGGAKDQPGALLIQKPGGDFENKTPEIILNDRKSEDTDALFFDADGDGDLDLYVASGGNEFSSSSGQLRDRLYFNLGGGRFEKSNQLLPAGQYENTACVTAADYDGDGDLDLFVGARCRPFLVGVPASGFLLDNDGRGHFKPKTAERAPDLKEIGMITDAEWADFDGDGDPDLVLVGDYMPVTIFENTGGKFEKNTLPASNGFWTGVRVADLDADGDPDLVLGNWGTNSRFRATPERPVRMYVNDFDQNGTPEQIITTYNGDKAYPFVLRHDLVRQMPSLKKKYLKYENYKDQTVEDIFTPEQLEHAIRLEAFETRSGVALNAGDGTFEWRPLPVEAQFSPNFGILTGDVNADGHTDILLAGNFYHSKPEVGIYDASLGTTLLGDGKGGFETVAPQRSGFFVLGEVRDLQWVRVGGKLMILVAKNDDAPEIFELKTGGPQ
ncbi:MAG: hypothetical protein D6714_02960, partial [Bacteroidetes bacterium]